MKIQTPLIDIKDQLLNFISEGYGIMGEAFMNSFNSEIPNMRQLWENKVVEYLESIFPTKKESGQFKYTPYNTLIYLGMATGVQDAINRTEKRIQILESILDNLEKYYQFEPEKIRLYIEGIDSFSQVRGVNHDEIAGFLKNGFFKYGETAIKEAFAKIVGESFVPNHYGVESDYLFTSRFFLNADRFQTSLIL